MILASLILITLVVGMIPAAALIVMCSKFNKKYPYKNNYGSIW